MYWILIISRGSYCETQTVQIRAYFLKFSQFFLEENMRKLEKIFKNFLENFHKNR